MTAVSANFIMSVVCVVGIIIPIISIIIMNENRRKEMPF